MTADSEKYRLIFEEAIDPIFIAATESGLIEDCNTAAVEMTGYRRDEIIGRHQKFLHPPAEHNGEFSRTYRQHTHNGGSGTVLESKLQRKDGETRDILIKATTFEFEGRNLIMGFFHDITEQKAVERERESIAKFPSENHNPVLRVDEKGHVLYANRAACRLFGVQESIRTGFPEQLRESVQLAVKENTPRTFEYAQGERVYQFTTAPIAGEDYVNLYGADISARISTESALKLMEERSRLALKAANFGTWDWNMRTGQLVWSEAVEPMFGLKPGQFSGTFKEFLDLVHPDDRQSLLDAVKDARKKNQDYEVEHRIIRPDGRECWLREIGAVLKDPNDEPTRMVGIVEDITEKKKTRDRIDFLALHDPLTELYNRLAFLDHVGKALERANRHENQLALAYIDLDGFKEINDTLGHAAGDQVLREVASRLQSAVRTMDFTARLGGDEFAILFQDFTDRQECRGIMTRILEEIRKPIDLPEEPVTVGVSIGVALFPDDADDSDSLLKKADEAMYTVKHEGKNNFGFYVPR